MAAVRYYEAFKEAKEELVEQLSERSAILKHLDPNDLESFDKETQFLALAYPLPKTISRLKFAPIISGSSGRIKPSKMDISNGSKSL